MGAHTCLFLHVAATCGALRHNCHAAADDQQDDSRNEAKREDQKAADDTDELDERAFPSELGLSYFGSGAFIGLH